MTNPEEITTLHQRLADAEQRLATLHHQVNPSSQSLTSVQQEIADYKDQLEALGTQLSEVTVIRHHTLTIEGQARVDVAVAGDLIYKLLPARVPRYPSTEEITQGNELLDYMPIPPTESPTQPRPFLLSGVFPLRHNPLFVGRDTMLQELAQRLKPVGAKAAISTGIGGVGKTTLAAEFAHRYGTFFAGGVFWISCADPNAIATQVAKYGGQGGLELWYPHEELSLEERVARVKRQWESELPRLVIFDNCDDWADATGELSAELILQDWMPHTGGCRVLVTSRRQEWSPALGVIDIFLDVLARPASITLLQSLASHLTDEEADRIAEAVGDLPLALYLAGGYLQRYRHVTTVDQFLTELMQIDPTQHRALRGDGTSYPPTWRYLQRARTAAEVQAELNVGRVFALSFDHLQADDPADSVAIALLARAACLAPGAPFDRPLLLETLQSSESDAEFTAVDGLERLVALGMLEKQGSEDLRIHRLVSSFASQAVDDGEAQEDVEAILIKQVTLLITIKHPAKLTSCIPHLRHIYHEMTIPTNMRITLVALTLGRAEQELLNYQAAQPLLEYAMQLVEQELEPLDALTATSHYYLGLLYYAQGAYDTAYPELQRALTIRESIFGTNHPDISEILNSLAILIKRQGNYSQAQTLYERALEICMEQFGSHHADTTRTLSNLATLCEEQGKYDQAFQLYHQALQLCEVVFGPHHLDTADVMNNLGVLYYFSDKYTQAEALYEKALRIRESLLGEYHTDIAISYNNLATLYDAQSLYDQALPLYERALTIRKKVLGIMHPDVAQSINNLGLFFKRQGDYQQALPLYEQALTIRQAVFGFKHPITAQSLNNIAGLYHAKKDYAAAQPLYEQALGIYEEVFGLEHPETTIFIHNLALLYQRQGKRKQALHYFHQALQLREKTLGLQHKDTADTLRYLAALYFEQKDYVQAEEIYRRALQVYTEISDSSNPIIAQVQEHLDKLKILIN
jgi:tetratricopeptide (TPR) repeat protein